MMMMDTQGCFDFLGDRSWGAVGRPRWIGEKRTSERAGEALRPPDGRKKAKRTNIFSFSSRKRVISAGMKFPHELELASVGTT